MYVDKATYKKYRATPSLRQAAGEHIEINPDARNNFQYARIKFPASNRCPFLADDNLCSIQKEHGSEFLSKTCARYPRALVRFDGKMQRALYLSCPEAARIVLLNPQLLPADGPRYQQFIPEGLRQITSSAADMAARQLRAFALDLLQDESYPLWQRMFVLGVISRRAHELTAAQQSAQISSLLAQYATMLQQGSLRSHLDNIPARPGLQLDLVLQLIRLRFELEPPHDSFACCVGDLLQAIGYSPTASLPEVAERYHQAYLAVVPALRPAISAFPAKLSDQLSFPHWLSVRRCPGSASAFGRSPHQLSVTGVALSFSAQLAHRRGGKISQLVFRCSRHTRRACLRPSRGTQPPLLCRAAAVRALR